MQDEIMETFNEEGKTNYVIVLILLKLTILMTRNWKSAVMKVSLQ